MVSRHEETAKTIVVDLDGTLLLDNSFRIYVREGLRILPASGKAALVFTTLLRKSGLMSHNAYRARAVRSIGFPSTLLNRMQKRVEACRSRAVENFIQEKRAEGFDIILATAALADYAHALWSESDGLLLASKMQDGIVTDDCRGERKLRRVLKRTGGLAPAFALSDSPSDEPLLRFTAEHGGCALLVNPTEATLRFYRSLPHPFPFEVLLD